MSFSLVVNNTNVSNTNTNATYTYNFIGGGFTVPDDYEVMLSSAQIPYSIFNITDVYNNNRFRLSFPTGAGAATFTDFNITIPDGFYTIEDLTSYMQQYAITNGLYLINTNGDNVYYTPAFYLNSVNYAIQILLYTVPRSLPVGWTQPTNWIGYSTYTADRTPHIHILANSKFGDYIGFATGVYPTPTLQTTNYSVLAIKNRLLLLMSILSLFIVLWLIIRLFLLVIFWMLSKLLMLVLVVILTTLHLLKNTSN